MKQAILLIVVISIVAYTTRDTYTFLTFKLDQVSIIESHCVNRDAPEKKCNGKCFLNIKLKKNREHKESPIQFSEKSNLYFCIPKLEYPKKASISVDREHAFYYANNYVFDYHARLLDPPQVAA